MGRRWGPVLLLVCATVDVASANSDDLYERLWPEMPNSRGVEIRVPLFRRTF